MMRNRNAWALLSLILLSTAGLASIRTASAADADQGPPIYCPDGLERLLPGDYYACRARYHLQRNNPQQAISMLEHASYWANKDAQHSLGLAYSQGDLQGTPIDKPLGLAWLALAAERKSRGFMLDYTRARAKCSEDEIARANELYVQLLAKYGDHVAGKRAMRRFDREVEQIDVATNHGGSAYISGFAPMPQAALTLSRQLHEQADDYFQGLHGTVMVGELTPTAGLPAGDEHN
ncbi:hypothetical protein [Dyella amyloliquefaciens]|uniref:hypothetical protein n=1 Tax=Dyella amyloliquefaciens TaxID=1770545 RepID=UPI00102ECC69|nr:hypothetical protein [Dyella amyloliquefaciens]